MDSIIAQAPAAQRSASDVALRIVRFVGLIGFLGGLAALASLWFFGPRPVDADQWHMLILAMRSVFYPCVFAGIVLLIISGTSIWWRRRKDLHGLRWFRVMMVMIVLAVPALHLSARFTMLRLHAMVEAADLEKAAQLWDRLGMLYCVAVVVFLVVSIIGMVKPRLGQRPI
jgi:putative copper export protein